MFNDDQAGYMRSLARLPVEEKCGCGWDLIGQCVRCVDGALRVFGVTCRVVELYPGRRFDYVFGAGADPGRPAGSVVDRAAAVEWLRSVASGVFTSPPTPKAPGRFKTPWGRATSILCLRCNTSSAAERTWESGCGSRDEVVFWCRTCGQAWWSEDPDRSPGHPLPENDDAPHADR